MISSRLKDKVCIVTGAAQGTGLATALKFAREGAIVAVSDLSRADVDEARSAATPLDPFEYLARTMSASLNSYCCDDSETKSRRRGRGSLCMPTATLPDFVLQRIGTDNRSPVKHIGCVMRDATRRTV